MNRSAIPERADVLHYENLSSNAQTAIDDALHGDRTIRGRANEPPEFFYSDYASVNHGIYFVERGGDYYRLTTNAGGGFFLVGLLVEAATVALGVVVGAVGLLSSETDRRWIPAGFGSYGLLVLLSSTVAPLANWQFGVAAAGGLGVVAGVGAIGAMVTRRSVEIVVAVGGVLLAILWSMSFLGPAGRVPSVLVSTVPLSGLTVLVGALAVGHLLGVGYERLHGG